MTLPEYKKSLLQSAPPAAIDVLLKALWFDAKGNWDMAHEIAQGVTSNDGSWIHAYLHRKEGDNGNAAYWYHKANRPVTNAPLEAEWEEIVTELLTHSA
jgi:hypothetical protein